MRPLHCLVYGDPLSLVEFSNPESSAIIREIAGSFGNNISISLTNGPDVRSGAAFESKPDIFVLPGIIGQTSLYPDHIGPEGNAHIRKFIAEGGTFFGVCAGAYYAASHIIYEPAWGPHKQRTSGTLGLFNGVARGPVQGFGRTTNDAPTTFFEEITHVDPLPIRIEDGPMEGTVFEVAYGLGPAFESAAAADTRVIARYAGLNNNLPAIIEVPHGRGHAILSGVLPQFGHEEDPARYRATLTPHLARLLSSLYAHRHTRRAFWDSLMCRIAHHHKARIT